MLSHERTGWNPILQHDMLRAFAVYHKLRYRTITLSKENYVKSGRDYARQIIPQAVLIDRLGVVRMVKSGATEEGIDAWATRSKSSSRRDSPARGGGAQAEALRLPIIPRETAHYSPTSHRSRGLCAFIASPAYR